MRKSMAATALSFLLAMGGGAALADSSSSGRSHSSPATSTSQAPASSSSKHTDRQANQPAAVGFAEEEVTSAPLTVESVDMKNRNLVVRAPDGTKSTVDIPAGTPGFDTLKKGDKVQLDYFAAAVFGPSNPQQPNRTSQTGSGANANAGSTASNANHGKVRNIRKVDDTASTGHPGTSSSSSGSEEGKR